jgi:glutamyl/glutaminyl-tRNA synthetase
MERLLQAVNPKHLFNHNPGAGVDRNPENPGEIMLQNPGYRRLSPRYAIMRSPTLYRIRRAAHHRTGEKWCIYPMYDFAHSLSDSIERITHSICTLEFEDHRPLYDWFQETLQVEFRSQQADRCGLALNLCS